MHPPGGELEARLDAGDNSPPTGDDSPVAVNSPTGERLTWEDELASLASYEYGPSLVVCRYCGDHIPETAPLARANGYCNKARCIAQQTQGRMA